MGYMIDAKEQFEKDYRKPDFDKQLKEVEEQELYEKIKPKKKNAK